MIGREQKGGLNLESNTNSHDPDAKGLRMYRYRTDSFLTVINAIANIELVRSLKIHYLVLP